MATNRKYAYYLKGNKIAIIEEGQGAGVCSLSGYNTQSACEDAGGTWAENASGVDDGQYRSPIQTIADGLEIQYAYSPQYWLEANVDQAGTVRQFTPPIWMSWQGYLTFGIPDFDWNDTFGTGNFVVGEKILIQGSSRWNGVHTIGKMSADDSDGTTVDLGLLQTTTRAHWDASIGTGCDISNSAKTITGNNTQDKNELAKLFPSTSETYYVWVNAADSATNNANLYKMTSDGAGVLTASSQYTVANAAIVENTTPVFADATNDTLTLVRSIYDPLVLYHKDSFVSIEDESFQLDLTRYQANAIVYYVKAKLAEDAMDMEAREYFMREFKRQLEKSTSALKRGPYIVQGFKGMR